MAESQHLSQVSQVYCRIEKTFKERQFEPKNSTTQHTSLEAEIIKVLFASNDYRR